MSTPRPTADIYYLATNTWSPTDQFFRDRFDHSETILGDGSLLIAGCMSGDPQAPTLATTAPVYDPAARYLALVNGPAKARHDHGEILLFDGTVLVVGRRILEGGISPQSRYLTLQMGDGGLQVVCNALVAARS